MLSYRFRWVYCQLEILRQCLPPSVRRVLDELPETLDETYERVLKDIKKVNREHAIRLLHCLTVAIRPLLTQRRPLCPPRRNPAVTEQFDQRRSRTGDERLKTWLNPTVNVLCSFSAIIGDGVGLASLISLPLHDLCSDRHTFSPTNVIFADIGVLLLVSTLVDIFYYRPS
jgi:hypothetical protein